MIIHVNITPDQWSMATQILTDRNGTEPSSKDIANFCRSTLRGALDTIMLNRLKIDEDSLSGIWWKLHNHWMRLGLTRYESTAIDEKAVSDAINQYGIDGVVNAIENYAEIACGETYYSVPHMEFDEFIVRGIDDFCDSAEPHEKYRRVNALSLARELKLHKSDSKVKVHPPKLKKIREWLDRRVERNVAGV